MGITAEIEASMHVPIAYLSSRNPSGIGFGRESSSMRLLVAEG